MSALGDSDGDWPEELTMRIFERGGRIEASVCSDFNATNACTQSDDDVDEVSESDVPALPAQTPFATS